MPQEIVAAQMQVLGEDEFVGAMNRMSGAAEGVGTAAEEQEGGLKGAAKNLGVAAVAAKVTAKGYGALKGSVDTTVALAKETAAFTRITGLSTDESQAWVVMMKSRGIEGRQMQMGMAKLSKSLGGLGTVSKTAEGTFKRLGITQEEMAKLPLDQQMGKVAEGFKALPDGIDKAAVAQQLFGRAGLQLLPVLNGGAESLKQNLDAAKDLVPANEDAQQKALDLAKAQRELDMATMGLKTSFGQAFVPVLTAVTNAMKPVMKFVGDAVRKFPPLGVAIAGVGIAMGGLLVAAKLQGALKALGISVQIFGKHSLIAAGAAKAWAAMQWILNASLFGCPLLLIVAGVAAIIAGLVLAYKNIGWFRDIVDTAFNAVLTAIRFVWDWVKGNWPLLLGILTGPFGLAVALIVTNWDTVKGVIQSVWNWIKGNWPLLLGVLTGPFGLAVVAIVRNWDTVKGAIKSLWGALKSGADAAINYVVGKFNWFVDFIKGIPARVGNLFEGLAEKAGSVFSSLNPFAMGGIVAAQTGLTAGGGTTALVGERGPEIASLPSGTRITPLPPPQLAPSQMMGGGQRPVVTQVFLDRRQIAEALGSFAADQQNAR